MKNQVARVAVVVSFAFGLVAATTVSAAEDDNDAVRAAAQEFYSALNSMFAGQLEPMKKVWSHKEDVTFMGPRGGIRIGWKQVLAHWEQQATLKLGGKVQPKDMRITVGRDLAVVSNYGIGNVTADGKARKVKIRTTSLFRKESGKWKMIGHHTDILPFLQK